MTAITFLTKPDKIIRMKFKDFIERIPFTDILIVKEMLRLLFPIFGVTEVTKPYGFIFPSLVYKR